VGIVEEAAEWKRNAEPEATFVEECKVRFLVRQCSNLGQAVTLLYTLYLVSSFLAMFSRKHVLPIGTGTSVEFWYVKEPGNALAVKIALQFLIHQI